jgi:hypothetical protein
MIEKKFNEMRESHERDKEEIIQVIKNESAAAIAAQINQLKV